MFCVLQRNWKREEGGTDDNLNLTLVKLMLAISFNKQAKMIYSSRPIKIFKPFANFLKYF